MFIVRIYKTEHPISIGNYATPIDFHEIFPFYYISLPNIRAVIVFQPNILADGSGINFI